jgi:hypothetical protein
MEGERVDKCGSRMSREVVMGDCAREGSIADGRDVEVDPEGVIEGGSYLGRIREAARPSCEVIWLSCSYQYSSMVCLVCLWPDNQKEPLTP